MGEGAGDEGESAVNKEAQKQKFMSLNKRKELAEIAKSFCRELRKNSTNAEIILWEAIRDRKLLNIKFRRQHPIFHDITGSESFFVADFYSHEIKLIIELDGIIHKYKMREDKERTEMLNQLGIGVIRFKNDEVEKNLEEVISDIRRKIKQRLK